MLSFQVEKKTKQNICAVQGGRTTMSLTVMGEKEEGGLSRMSEWWRCGHSASALLALYYQ